MNVLAPKSPTVFMLLSGVAVKLLSGWQFTDCNTSPHMLTYVGICDNRKCDSSLRSKF